MSNVDNKKNILIFLTGGFPFGRGETFIENEIEGAYIFRPNDHEELLKKIKSIKLNNSIYDRSDFFHKFKRNSIMDNMSKDILKLYQKI